MKIAALTDDIIVVDGLTDETFHHLRSYLKEERPAFAEKYFIIGMRQVDEIIQSPNVPEETKQAAELLRAWLKGPREWLTIDGVPHRYSPDAMAMGDCRQPCGNVREAHNELAPAGEAS